MLSGFVLGSLPPFSDWKSLGPRASWSKCKSRLGPNSCPEVRSKLDARSQLEPLIQCFPAYPNCSSSRPDVRFSQIDPSRSLYWWRRRTPNPHLEGSEQAGGVDRSAGPSKAFTLWLKWTGFTAPGWRPSTGAVFCECNWQNAKRTAIRRGPVRRKSTSGPATERKDAPYGYDGQVAAFCPSPEPRPNAPPPQKKEKKNKKKKNSCAS